MLKSLPNRFSGLYAAIWLKTYKQQRQPKETVLSPCYFWIVISNLFYSQYFLVLLASVSHPQTSKWCRFCPLEYYIFTPSSRLCLFMALYILSSVKNFRCGSCCKFSLSAEQTRQKREGHETVICVRSIDISMSFTIVI